MKPKFPDAAGAPLITPEDVSDTPAGRLPDAIVQIYGGVPPEAASVTLYAVPVVPAGSEVVVTVGGEPVPPPLVA